MKIRVSFTVEVDPQRWADEFGVEPSEVRDDVKRYITDGIAAHLAQVGA